MIPRLIFLLFAALAVTLISLPANAAIIISGNFSWSCQSCPDASR